LVPNAYVQELKTHAEMRERLLAARKDFGLVEHDARVDRTCPKDLVVLNSPMDMGEEEQQAEEGEEEEEGEVKPQLATPECSSDMIIIPDKRMVSKDFPMEIVRTWGLANFNVYIISSACLFKTS